MNDIVTPFSSDPMNSLGDITSEENQNRTCGTCAACCTQLGVNELKKHASQVCSHLKNGDPLRRCGIYPTRPKACHDIKVVDVQKKEVLHFLNGEIRSGKLLRQDKNDYESLAFVSHDPPIGRYETKEIKS